jgi:hypothetical protein
MAILLWTTVFVAVAAVAVTAHAVISAKDGVEDDLGFHSVAGTAIVKTDGGRCSSRKPGPRSGGAPPVRGGRQPPSLPRSLGPSHP